MALSPADVRRLDGQADGVTLDRLELDVDRQLSKQSYALESQRAIIVMIVRGYHEDIIRALIARYPDWNVEVRGGFVMTELAFTPKCVREE